MSMRKTETPGRILAHQAAHELSREEIDSVAGGTDCLFTSSYDAHGDDVDGDCQYP